MDKKVKEMTDEEIANYLKAYKKGVSFGSWLAMLLWWMFIAAIWLTLAVWLKWAIVSLFF